jgi:L-threonylcarbamoyladenylate synthase
MTSKDGSGPGTDGSLTLATRALRAGRVVAVPTDTVYGLAVDPLQPEAVRRLFAMKDRPAEVAVPLLVEGWDQVSVVAGPLDGPVLHLAERYWPGPVTLVVRRRPSFTADLGGPPSGRETVGVRWPDHPVIRSLCRELGPLAVTSANRHGALPASRPEQVEREFGAEADLAVVVDGGVCGGPPSTVVGCLGTEIRCLREGAIAWSEVTGGTAPADGSGERDRRGPDSAGAPE